MKKNSPDLNKLAIKARVFNQFRKSFHKIDLEELSSKDKETFLIGVVTIVKFAHKELNKLKAKKKAKAKVEALRQTNGYYTRKQNKKDNPKFDSRIKLVEKQAV